MRKFSLEEAKKRSSWICGLILLLLAGVILRLVYLQLISGDKFNKIARRQIIYEKEKGNPRGEILDRNGEEFAVSIMSESLYVEPSMLTKQEKAEGGDGNLPRFLAELLAPILKMDENELFRKCLGEEGFVWLKRSLDPEEARQVREIIEKYNLSGLQFVQESKRYYTKKHIAAQVLGFVDLDDEGRSGLELALNRELRGAITRRKVFCDAKGKVIFDDVKNFQNMVPKIYLTLDMKMQYTLERAIDEAMAETKSKGAAAIIMDPLSGEILAMVSRPNFDPNHYWDYKPEDWQNKCIGYNYEPGSVFKPIVGCAALERHVVDPNTPMFDRGILHDRENEINISNWNDRGRGKVTFSEVIKYSINTCMAEVGLKLGRNNLMGFTQAFGFGKRTGIELAGEESGILHEVNNMYKADVAVMSLGQGIMVTPLQMLRAICAIANGGELLKPYIIKKIEAPNGEISFEGKKTVIGHPISMEVAKKMRYMMEQVVASGGGRAAGIKGYRIAGKTGTAQKLTAKGDYIGAKYIASFVGFVPAENPQYAMLVMLDEPQGKDFYGAQVASPVFRNTLQQILAAKGVQPQNKDDLKGLDELATGQAQRYIPVLVQENDGRVRVPDFLGADMRACSEALKGKLQMRHHGSGKAFRQSPPAGTLLPEQEIIEIWFK